MLGNERRPMPKYADDLFREYNFIMEQENINYDIVEIEVPKLMCVTNLAMIRQEPQWNGPMWRAKDDEVAKVDGSDEITCWDVSIALFLIDVLKQEAQTKQKIKVKLSKNVQAIIKSEGLM